MNLAPLVLVSVCSIGVAAQQGVVVPPFYEHLWAGNNGSGTGIAAERDRAQMFYSAPFAAGSVVTEVAFRRAASTTDSAPFQVECAISLSSTANSALSAVYANNLGPDVTVIAPRQLYDLPSFSANCAPDDCWVRFPTLQPWVFQGPNVVVDVATFSSTGLNSGFRVDRCVEHPLGEAISWGDNCGQAAVTSISANGQYLAGSEVDMMARGVAPNTPATVITGFDAREWIGLRLPVDLAPVGLPGCHLSITPFMTWNVVATGDGMATARLSIPPVSTVEGQRIAFQWLYTSLTVPNALNLAVSNARLITVGPRTCPNQYLYSLRSATATTGTLLPGGPVVRFGL